MPREPTLDTDTFVGAVSAVGLLANDKRPDRHNKEPEDEARNKVPPMSAEDHIKGPIYLLSPRFMLISFAVLKQHNEDEKITPTRFDLLIFCP